LPIDIHEETPFELKEGDYIINEHGSYFINTPLNPWSYEKFHELIGLSNIASHEIFNPLIVPAYKDLKGWL
jgi:hypothetical protein